MSKPYNGHKNWNHWNVSLWINNDEGLYRMAKMHISCVSSKELAAKQMLEELIDLGKEATPDGALYSVTTIRAAMRGM